MSKKSIIDNEHFKLVNSRFPHIGKKIEFLWGEREFDTMINKLFSDTRGDTRQGFPLEIADALLKLMMLHDTEFPYYKDIDAWGNQWER